MILRSRRSSAASAPMLTGSLGQDTSLVLGRKAPTQPPIMLRVGYYLRTTSE